jgi:GPI mannosyltransferase 3
MPLPAVKRWQVLLLSSVALLILAVYSVGYYHPDEHFQILEFAGLKLNLTRAEYLPWEYHALMRPSIQPAIVVLVHRAFGLFGYTDPFTITIFLRMLSGALTFAAMWMIYRRYTGDIREPILQKWFLLLSFLLWFALYNGIRFSSETWSGAIFIIGFSYLFSISRKPGPMDYLFTGLLLGLSFIVRYQAVLLIAGFLAWFVIIRRERMANMAWMIAGILVAVIAGIIIDRWFYGEWVLTAWNYFEQNILEDKISGFGLSPWYFYFQDVFIRTIPPFSLVIILSFIVFLIFRPKDLLTWTLLPFILIHFFLGHKETRFFYPLIGFIPVIFIRAIGITSSNWGIRLWENKPFVVFAKISWVVNIALILFSFFNPADSQVNMYSKIYHTYTKPITLYYLDEDPYHKALDIHYYKRADLTIKKAESAEQLNADTSAIFLLAVRNRNGMAGQVGNKRLIISTLPQWVRRFNFNHWVDRTEAWKVYEVTSPKCQVPGVR